MWCRNCHSSVQVSTSCLSQVKVFWYFILCGFVGRTCHLRSEIDWIQFRWIEFSYPENGGCTFLRNVGIKPTTWYKTQKIELLLYYVTWWRKHIGFPKRRRFEGARSIENIKKKNQRESLLSNLYLDWVYKFQAYIKYGVKLWFSINFTFVWDVEKIQEPGTKCLKCTHCN